MAVESAEHRRSGIRAQTRAAHREAVAQLADDDAPAVGRVLNVRPAKRRWALLLTVAAAYHPGRLPGRDPGKGSGTARPGGAAGGHVDVDGPREQPRTDSHLYRRPGAAVDHSLRRARHGRHSYGDVGRVGHLERGGRRRYADVDRRLDYGAGAPPKAATLAQFTPAHCAWDRAA